MKAKRMWEYDDNDEPVSNLPIGSLDEPVKFDGDWSILKIFNNDKRSHDVPQINIFDSEGEGAITVRYHFIEIKEKRQLEFLKHFESNKAKILEELCSRWGEAKMQWGGPGYKKSNLAAELVIYYEEGDNGGIWGSIWLDRNFIIKPSITIRQLFDDFDFLEKLYLEFSKEI